MSKLTAKTKNQNINVAVRCRPINNIEKKQSSCSILSCDKVKNEVTIKEKSGGVHPFTKTYNFDHVFGPDSLQVDVYKAVVKPVVEEVLTGYNCTIFAYGQTGTGKTFTMEGEKSNNSSLTWQDDPLSGVIPRALHQIFEDLQKQPDVEFSLRVSFMELYNEELFDLLGSSVDPLRLRIYEDNTKKGSVIISGLEEVVVRTKDEVFEILQRGTAKRQTAATLMNDMSSRSHSVFSVTIHIKENTLEGEELLKTGKLYLVDLAGSENIGRSGAVDKRAREAGNINQSLLTLGRVITALVEHAPHIPYRESKLTRLLQDSLGGRTKTSIIATISPASVNFEETVSTLDYAFRAKNITNRPEVNQKLTKKALLKEYNEEIERLRRDLQASREKNGIYIAEDNYVYLQNKLSQQTDAIQEFEDKISTLTEEMKTLNEMFTDTQEELASASEKLVETTETLDQTTKELNLTKIDLKETRQDRDEKQFLVQEHVKNESSLYSEADELMTTVKTTINDVEGLHDKVDRKKAVEEHNENALNVFKGDLAQHVTDMKRNINSLNEKKSKFTSQMSGFIDGLVTQQTESLGGVKNELEEIESFVNQKTGVMLTQQEGNQEYLKTFAHVVEKDIEAFKAKSVTSLNEIGAKTLTQVDTISEEAAVQAERVTIIRAALQRQEQEQVQFIEGLIDQFKSMMKDVVGIASDYLNKQIEENIRLKEEMENTSQKLAEYDEELLSYAQNIKSKIQKRKELFVQHTDHVQTYAGNHHTSIGSVQTELKRKETESLQTAANQITDSLKKNNQANMESLNQTHGAFITVEKGCQDLSMLTRKFVSESEQIWNDSAEGLKKGVDEMISNAMTDYTKAHDVIQSFESEYKVKNSSTRNTLNETQDVMKGLLQNQKDLHNHHDSDVATAIDSHKQQLIATENMCNALVSDELKKDIPTGCTPRRVVFSYPRTLTKTEQHQKLLEHFRISQPQEMTVTETEIEVFTPDHNVDEGIHDFKGSLDNLSDAGSLISIASSGISTFSSISKENEPKFKKASTNIKKAPPKTPSRSSKKPVNARAKLPLRSSNRD